MGKDKQINLFFVVSFFVVFDFYIYLDFGYCEKIYFIKNLI